MKKNVTSEVRCIDLCYQPPWLSKLEPAVRKELERLAEQCVYDLTEATGGLITIDTIAAYFWQMAELLLKFDAEEKKQ